MVETMFPGLPPIAAHWLALALKALAAAGIAWTANFVILYAC